MAQAGTGTSMKPTLAESVCLAIASLLVYALSASVILVRETNRISDRCIPDDWVVMSGTVTLRAKPVRQAFHVPGLAPRFITEVHGLHRCTRYLQINGIECKGYVFKGEFIEPVQCATEAVRDSLIIYRDPDVQDSCSVQWTAWPPVSMRALAANGR